MMCTIIRNGIDKFLGHVYHSYSIYFIKLDSNTQSENIKYM